MYGEYLHTHPQLTCALEIGSASTGRTQRSICLSKALREMVAQPPCSYPPWVSQTVTETVGTEQHSGRGPRNHHLKPPSHRRKWRPRGEGAWLEVTQPVGAAVPEARVLCCKQKLPSKCKDRGDIILSLGFGCQQLVSSWSKEKKIKIF